MHKACIMRLVAKRTPLKGEYALSYHNQLMPRSSIQKIAAAEAQVRSTAVQNIT
jgi:hypothetical protein